MGLLKTYYKLRHPGMPENKIPPAYRRSIMQEVWHVIRKFICQNIAPNCVTNFAWVNLYRLCGFKWGALL